jgi:hypothetical protein
MSLKRHRGAAVLQRGSNDFPRVRFVIDDRYEP